MEDEEAELEAAPAGHADTPPEPDDAAVTADTAIAGTQAVVAEAAPEAVAPGAAAIAEPPLPRDPAPASEPAPAPAAVPIPPVRQAPPVIDEEVLGELRTILGEEVEHLIDVFLEDTPKLLARLEIAASNSDYDGLRDAAHSLKSSSANLGAMLLSAAARRVEQGAREQSLERPAVAVALVVNEFARARRQLKAGSRAGA